MSTAHVTAPDGLLRTLWTPQDAAQVRVAVAEQRRRMGAFLVARDLLTSARTKVGATTAELIERLHLTKAVQLVKKAGGWLLGGLCLLYRGVRTPGVLPGIGWLFSTTPGRWLLLKLWQPVKQAASSVGGLLMSVTTTVLRFFGKRGAQAAGRLEGVVLNAAGRVRTQVTSLVHLLGAFLPLKTVSGVIGTVCRERALRSALSRWLSPSWSILARVVVNIVMLPAAVRRQLVGLVRAANAPVKTTPVAPVVTKTLKKAAPVAGAKEASEQLPFADAAQQGELVDLDQERTERLDPDAKSLQRYPAGRSQHAKRK